MSRCQLSFVECWLRAREPLFFSRLRAESIAAHARAVGVCAACSHCDIVSSIARERKRERGAAISGSKRVRRQEAAEARGEGYTRGRERPSECRRAMRAACADSAHTESTRPCPRERPTSIQCSACHLRARTSPDNHLHSISFHSPEHCPGLHAICAILHTDYTCGARLFSNSVCLHTRIFLESVLPTVFFSRLFDFVLILAICCTTKFSLLHSVTKSDCFLLE